MRKIFLKEAGYSVYPIGFDYSVSRVAGGEKKPGYLASGYSGNTVIESLGKKFFKNWKNPVYNSRSFAPIDEAFRYGAPGFSGSGAPLFLRAAHHGWMFGPSRFRLHQSLFRRWGL